MTQPTPPQLAIHGGPKAVTSSPPSWPMATQEVRDALIAAFDEGRWGRYHGTAQDELRRKLSELTTQKHAWLCASGTIAVELALRACRVGSEDEVILAGYDFPGNFRAIEAVGARPVLCDIRPATWCLDVELVEEAIGPQTKAIIASHLHGGQVEMQRLRAISQERSLQLIEDACQCPGATVEGRPAGAWGDVGVFSFGGSKLLSAGRGGALVTSDDTIAQRVKLVVERGNDAFPLSELQASVLLPQLDELERLNELRHKKATWIREQLVAVPGVATLAETQEGSPAYYKFPLLLTGQPTQVERSVMLAALQAEGVSCDIGFRGFGKRSTRRCRMASELTNANLAAQQTMLLHHPTLIGSQQLVEQTVAGISKVAQALLGQD